MRAGLLLAVPIAVLAAGGSAALGQSSSAGSPPGTPVREEGSVRQEQGLTLAAPDLASNPVLIEAAKTRPIPPETLERLLPAKVAGLTRSSASKKVERLGPAMLSVATAQYGTAAQRMVELSLLDPGGLEGQGDVLPLPPKGGSQEFAGRTIRREEVAGFPAAVAAGQDGLPSLLQVSPGGRVRLTMTGYGVTTAELVKAAESVDLARLAALSRK